LLLASTSPQRPAILHQLRIPFEVVAPRYEERGEDPVEHAAGKAHSVEPDDRPVLGVDTIVVCEGRVLGKPANATEAEAMLEQLSGRTHEVISGLCLRTPSTSRAGSGRGVPARTRSRVSAPRSWSGSKGTT
jgi:septum formation protein